jgi:hypothetical protein
MKTNMATFRKRMDEVWLWITYGVMSLSICVLMYEVYTLKEEIRTLKQIKLKK